MAAASPAAAADAIEPIRVRVEGHPGCPDEVNFTEQVRARTRKARPAAQGESARSFRVIVLRDGEVSRGRLIIADPRDASSFVRSVSGQTCEEVMSAMALITALAIDPEPTHPAEPPSGAPPSAPLAGAPPVAASAEPAFSAAARASWLSVSVPRAAPYLAPASAWDAIPMPLPVLPSRTSDREQELGWRFAAGVSGAAIGAVAPELIPALSLFFDAQRRSADLFSPAFRLSVTRAQSGSFPTNAGLAVFRLTEGRLDACPLDVPIAAPLGLSPCLAFEAGALEAAGDGLVSSAAHARPWAAFGLLARLHLVLGDRIRVEAEAGTSFPLVRDTFYFAPEIVVHNVPAVGGFLGGAAAVCFP